MKSLFKKLYVAGGFQASNANSPTYTTSAGIVIPKNPNKEAGVLDVHRYCTSHPIEDESVEVKKRLMTRRVIIRRASRTRKWSGRTISN